MSELVELTEAHDGILIDIAYATAHNFTGEPVYKMGKCFLHHDAHKCLITSVALAAQLGYRIKVFDAFRPSEAQWKLWEHTPDPNFLAPPERGSPHSRGVAVDLTLTQDDGTDLEMGTAFDEFSLLSHHGNTEISAEAQRNRHILMGIMTYAGWDFYRNEWWHYQLFNSREYRLYSDEEAQTGMM